MSCWVILRCGLAGAPSGFHQVDALVEGLGNDVPVMQERVLLEPDVDERGFQARFEVLDFALEDAGDDPFRSVVRSMLNSSSWPSSMTATRFSSASALTMISL